MSLGDKRVRIVVSNEFGNQPFVIAAAHLAHAGSGSSTVAGTGPPVTFGGKASAVVLLGAPLVSDHVEDYTPKSKGSNGISMPCPMRWTRLAASK
jgi:hypothetical protein